MEIQKLETSKYYSSGPDADGYHSGEHVSQKTVDKHCHNFKTI